MMSEKAGERGEQPDYQSYLLRLWRVDQGENAVQASLESTHTGERRGFANLEAMLDFLRGQMAVQAERTSDERQGRG
jgi:hypothetical protein